MRRFMLAATNSGCGKTTVTMAVLSALMKKHMSPSCFKCGPDYIDPMFHRKLGIDCWNLDSYFLDERQLKAHLASHKGDVQVIEGVMGYYDGVGDDLKYSSYEAARLTGTPVVLIINGRGLNQSALAMIDGFVNFRSDSDIQGVIFNNIREGHYKMMKAMCERHGIRCFGYLPQLDESMTLSSRHLGLVTPDEIDDIHQTMDKLGDIALECIDIDGLLSIEADDGEESYVNENITPSDKRRYRIAITRDEAFSFLYEENVEVLEEKGFEIVYFSPIHDKKIPPCDVIYITGGYPELHLKELSENSDMIDSIRKFEGKIIAECGGFMYLSRTVDDVPMVGLVDCDMKNTGKPVRFGYHELVADNDSILLKKGERLRIHEFHYWDGSDNGSSCTIRKAGRDVEFKEVFADDRMFVGFPHLYFREKPEMIDRLREMI